MNLGGRDADYSHKPPAQFVEEANRRNFVAIQIETLGALNEVDAIAAIDDAAAAPARPVPTTMIL